MMARVSQSWIKNNLDFLTFVLSNDVILGKKSLASQDKLLRWLEANCHDFGFSEADGIPVSRVNLLHFLSEMEYQGIITSRRHSGVTYYSAGDDYANLKKELTEKKVAPPEIVEELPASPVLSSLSPLQAVYAKLKEYSGDGKEYLIDLPRLIDLGAHILYDARSDWKIKSIISSVLGFLLVGNEKEVDYFDDLFAVSFALKYVNKEASYLIPENWHYEDNYNPVLNRAYQTSRLILSDAECREILHLLGIPKIIHVDERFDMKSAVGAISYLMGQIYNSPDKYRKLDYAIDKLVSLGIYDDVQRVISIAQGDTVPKADLPEIETVLTDEEFALLMGDDI